MSVNSLKTQTEELQAMYTAFKTGYQTHLDTTIDYENRFMNAFEDFSCFITKGMQDLTSIIDKHIQLVSKIQDDHEKNKFEEGNFNKVSLIKKQDTNIRQLEIKVAELESKLLATKNYAVNPTLPVCTSVPSAQCSARVGKAKYNISKQSADFMNDFPAGSYVTKTGCVVGLACPNMTTVEQVFCPDHNNGKFEDIRQEPGTTQSPAPITDSAIITTAEQSPAPEKKGKGRKQPAKKQDANISTPTTVDTGILSQCPGTGVPLNSKPALGGREFSVNGTEPTPVVILTPAEPEPVVILTPAEPTPVVILTPAEPEPTPVVILTPAEPEPIILTPAEPTPVVILTPAEPTPVVILTPAEPTPVVILTPAEPTPVVILTPALPFIINEPDIELTDEETEPLDIQPSVEEDIQPELVNEHVIKSQEPIQQDNMPLPNFDDIEFYDDPSNNRTYYLDSKTKRIFEIAPNDEIGMFVKFI